MNSIKNIRNLYTPLQPSVRSSNNVSYCEHLPHIELQDFIYCYWELKTTSEINDPFSYRVVSDGCIDIFFELNNSDQNFVMGFCKKYTAFLLGNNFHYVGIRFLPTAFPQLFEVDASILSNKFQELRNISLSFSELIANGFQPGMESLSLVKNLDDLLFEKIRNLNFNNDNRLYDAIDIILDKFGVINLNIDLDIGISQRQLRRLFNYYIGDTPKSFSKVVRFQNILKAKPSSQSLRKNKLFYDLGYFDQAHFIKDFKNFYGVTPSKAFGRE